MEGIMMRAKNGYSEVVRNAKGEMVLSRIPLEPASSKRPFFDWPIVRGSVRLIDSLTIGMKALSSSAEIAIADAEEEDKKEKENKKETKKVKENKKAKNEDKEKDKDNKGTGLALGFALFLSLAISVTLFMILPNLIADWILPDEAHIIFYKLLEAIVRLVIFIGYMFLVSRMKDIRRVFMYHGAEHKTIHCFEHQEELTVENVRKYSKHHPRCGTAFLFVVMIVSIIIYSFIPKFDVLFGLKWMKILNILLRLLLLPLVAGIAYEFNRFAGRSESRIAKILRAPGMAMQRFTTVEPEDSMIECAILALKEALKLDDVPNFSFAAKLAMSPTPVDINGVPLKNNEEASEEESSVTSSEEPTETDNN